MLPYSKLTSLAQARSGCVPFNFSLSCFASTFLMACSKTNMKSNDEKASPCFRALLRGNASDKCLPLGFK